MDVDLVYVVPILPKYIKYESGHIEYLIPLHEEILFHKETLSAIPGGLLVVAVYRKFKRNDDGTDWYEYSGIRINGR